MSYVDRNELLERQSSDGINYDDVLPRFVPEVSYDSEPTSTANLTNDSELDPSLLDVYDELEDLSLCNGDLDEFEQVIAIADFAASDDTQLSLKEGDSIVVVSKETDNWWWGEVDGVCGYFPVNHVQLKGNQEVTVPDWQDEEYYRNYGKLKIHLEMLSDSARTEKYLEAVNTNIEAMRDKIVLDVGCGTGIVCLFCARYGHAKHVYGVEASDAADFARLTVAQNNLSDRITIINSKLEDAQLPEKVDLIVSEWMGTLLLAEGMLHTVLKARELFLKPGGRMWPTTATLFLCPTTANKTYANKIQFWDNVFDFNFSCLREKAQEEFFGRPVYDYVAATEECLSAPFSVLEIDIENIDSIQSFFSSALARFESGGIFRGFCSWFEVSFCNMLNKNDNEVVLNTGPSNPLTHWKHPLLLLDEHTSVNEGDLIQVDFNVNINKTMPRHWTVSLKGSIFSDGKEVYSFCKEFPCWR